MSVHVECEGRIHRALHELRESSEIQILAHEFEGAPLNISSREEVDEALQQQLGTRLPRALHECTAAHEPFGFHWRLEHGPELVTGEFNLRPPVTSLPVEPPSLEWSLSNSEQEISQQLLLFDDFPGGGTDAYTGLRVRPDTESPEVWYHEAERGALILELDYCTYLCTLVVTKGALGWHFLFADVSFSEPEFSSYLKGLMDMLQVLPELFPDYDYAPLRERLEARL